ncbi:hypothetical protein GCM10027186_06620 [Micromonospora schwarzwaldensis]
MDRRALPCRGTGTAQTPSTTSVGAGTWRARQLAACTSLTGMDIVRRLPYCGTPTYRMVGI